MLYFNNYYRTLYYVLIKEEGSVIERKVALWLGHEIGSWETMGCLVNPLIFLHCNFPICEMSVTLLYLTQVDVSFD